MANPVVTFTMADGSVMKAELYPEVAPNTVNNFISLVKKGFYEGEVGIAEQAGESLAVPLGKEQPVARHVVVLNG